MKIKNYSVVADIYSYLMRKVDYADWADYILQLGIYSRREIKTVLELAAGNCAIAEFLRDKYDLLIATDISFEMLNEAESKKLNRVACNMKKLPFNYRFDFIYSTFDSINYLLTEEEVADFFTSISECMHSNSLFTFDVSLEKNSLKYVKKLNRSGKVGKKKFKQFSHYERKTKIHTNRFVITDEYGNNYVEIHKQRIYDLIEFFEIIENCGMFVIECFDAFTFEDADLNSERAQFLIKKGS